MSDQTTAGNKVASLLFASVLLLVIPAVSGFADNSGDPVLVRKLIGRNQVVRSRTLGQLESDRTAAAESLPALVLAAERISQDTEGNKLVGPYMVRLIHLIGTINDDLAEQGLVQLLDSPHAGIAMIAADTLGQEKFYGAIDYLKRQINHPEFERSYAFRFNLMRALMQMEHPDAIEFVTAQGKTLDGQLKYKIDQALDKVAVEDFRGDQQRFQQWSAGRSGQAVSDQQSPGKDAVIFKQATQEPESLKRIRLAKQQYYGIEIHAKRLMFIIDHSGSMKEYYDGQTRLERAKVELIRAIDYLPSSSEFALVFYDAKVASWRDKLVPATEENKKDAKYFVRTLRPGDTTNTHGALRAALDFDETLEAVFLLTDGRPTAGDIVHPDLIVDDILHRNRFRHLNFNTIGIALSDQTERFLMTLSEQSGGEFRAAK